MDNSAFLPSETAPLLILKVLLTFTLQLYFLLLHVAVMVALPFPTADTIPFEDTFATDVLLDFHVTFFVVPVSFS